jgi:hypothetical protein
MKQWLQPKKEESVALTIPDIPECRNLSHDPLPQSYKGRFGFTLACPSFIYPDHILPNVCMLAPFVDQIEVLVFESTPDDNLPPRNHVAHLAEMTKNGLITYNVHLPVDADITWEDKSLRLQAVKQISKAVARVSPLCPSTWTLHLPCSLNSMDKNSLTRWQHQAQAGVKALIKLTGLNPRSISVENLGYRPEWIEPVVRELDLSVCLDIGHLIEHGFGPEKYFNHFMDRITIVHLYGGTRSGRGHLGLDRLAPEHAPFIAAMLREFSGIVSVEVFSRKDLIESLKALENLVCTGKVTSSGANSP